MKKNKDIGIRKNLVKSPRTIGPQGSYAVYAQIFTIGRIGKMATSGAFRRHAFERSRFLDHDADIDFDLRLHVFSL